MNNFKAIKYLEQVKDVDYSEFDGESLENVSLTDAVTACKIQELETLSNFIESVTFVHINDKQTTLLISKEAIDKIGFRKNELEKQLKNIKLK